MPDGPIDVYWRGKQNGGLMLLLAHLMSLNSQWRGHEIRLIRIIPKAAGRAEVEKHLHDLCDSSRIIATPLVVVHEDAIAAIHQTSLSAAEVYLGFQPPAEGTEAGFYASMERWVGPLQRVVFVCSAGGMELSN